MNIKNDSARMLHGLTRWLPSIARRLTLTAAVAFVTAMAAADMPVAYAAGAVATSAKTTMTAASAGYSKHNLRPRFVVPKGHRRGPHTKGNDYKNEPFVATANNILPASASSLSALPPPTGDDLSQSDDVVLTPAIKTLAQSLNNNPVAIYNWVRDHVVFTPTYGSIQGADATLQTLHGNAFDTSSLLIALLRASNIPARYAYGTIEIPAALAQNWVGGVSVPEAAVSLFDEGGIPAQGVTSGGAIGSIQIEHVWVEAYVDFNPSRGAVNRSATTWVPFDAAYKQYQYTPGMSVRADVQVDTATLAGQITQGATLTPDGVTALNMDTLAGTFADFTDRVANYIAAKKANATVADVLGTRETIAEDLPLLAGALPYKTVALGAVYATLPDSLRWRMQYGVYASEFDRTQGNALVTVTQSLPQMAGKRLTLSFAGATAADNNKLTTLLNSSPLPSTINGATIQTTAQLTFDGQVISSGGNVAFGTALVGGLGIFDPQIGDWTYTPSARVIAGETHSLAAVGGGVSPAMLAASRDKLNAMSAQLGVHNYAGLTQDGFTGEILNYAGLAYTTTVASNTDLMCKACGIVGYALPTIARVSTRAAVTLANGVPQSVSFPGVALNVEMLGRTAVATDNNAARALNFQRTYGERASAYTDLLLDALFIDAAHAGKTASTVRAITAANTAKQEIFQITSSNSNSVLPQLAIDPNTINVITDAIGAGRTATISRGNVAVGAWNGVGYLLEDPGVGSGDYEISGRDEAELDVAGGWLPLAMAGTGFTVQGDAIAAQVQGIPATESAYYNAAVALLADYSTIAWNTFVGSKLVLSQWFLCDLWDGLPGLISDPGTTVTSTTGVDDFTDLPGAPQTNNPPLFTSAPVLSGAVGQPYQYFATATDPDGDALTFALVSGPSGMSMAANGLVSWASPITGTYPITLRVSDGKANTDQTFTLTIGQVMPLDLNLGVAPQFVNVGDTVTITVATTGGSGNVSKSLNVDGATVALDANGQAKITAQAAGAHTVVATATDNKGSVTRTSAFGVAVAGDTVAPTVQIIAPADSDVLTAPKPVTGTVSDANLMLWQLLVSPTGQGQWHELGRGTQAITNGALATFDPTTLANGQYDLNLIAYDANGHQASSVIHVIVQGNLKLGMFTVSFNDLSLDVGGVPLTITRTYDSRKKDEQGDFGYGWTLSYQNIKLQRNRPLGEQWEIYQPGFLTFCIRPVGKRVVSIALADGKVHQFDVVASPDCATGQVPEVFQMAFNPRPGTTSTLVPLDAVDLLYQGNNAVDSNTGDPFDSVRYQLTTLDNYKYILASSDGAHTFQVTQIIDPNGEALTIDAQGVRNSNGVALNFTRDANKRITKITDPAGRTVNYTYTANGDLDSITSPTNQTSRNQYATVPATLAHLLTSYTDATGTLQLRNEYDASGRLIAQYDALGNKVDMSQRDLANHTQSVTDRNGNTTTYTFDDDGNITKTVDALNGVTQSTFDAYANELTHTDPLQHTSSTTYDTESGTVLGTKDALGHTTSQSWNFYKMMGNHTPQNLQSTTDELGHTTGFAYTDPGMLKTISDPLGHSTSFAYTGTNFDHLLYMQDPTGNTTGYQHDARGTLLAETDPAGNTTRYGYDTAGHLLTTTKTRVVNGQTQTLVTTNTVDANGNILSVTDPQGHVTKSTWTVLNKLDTQTDALGHVTKYSYDLTGKPIKTTYADGTSESTGYDANENPTTQTDRAGRVTKTDYDPLNRPSKVTNPDNSTTTTKYYADGSVWQSIDELTRVTQFQYDAAGRKTQSTDPAQHVTKFGYDDAGKLTSVTDALQHTTSTTFDNSNRLTQTTWPDQTFTQYGYDNAGRKTSETDPANRTTQYHYDADGRLDQVTDALTHITKYGYDELGDKTSQTDALNHVTQWAYDELGRATSHTLPDGRYETMGYDAGGRLVNQTDFAGNASGYSYDAVDRVTKQTFADGTSIATSYTSAGRTASLTDIGSSSKAIKYTYDVRDRLTDIVNPDNSKLHYAYDAAGQKTSEVITTPDGQSTQIDYTYDAAGNLQTVTANGKTFTYHYDDANRKTERDDPNGLVTKYSYDDNGRLKTWVTTKGSAAGAPIVNQGTYTLNAAGQRTALAYQAPDGQTRNLGYGYDGAGRLTSETRSLPAHNATWTLDAVGNRTAQTKDGQTSSYGYDTTDRLTAITGANAATYTWDTNGQLQSKTVGSAKTTYTFDARHELIGVNLPDGSTIGYTYAADGNIASRTKTVNGTATTTNYLVDPNLVFSQVAAEYDQNGHASAIYVDGDELLLRISGSQTTDYHHDGLGSVTALTDDSGNAVQTYGYDAWGNSVESTGTDANPYQYAGERVDQDTGLIYLRARWYEPGVGRFVSADSIDGAGSRPVTLNKYLYANVDPANRRDPGGNFVDTGSTAVATNIVGAMATFAVVGVGVLPLALGPGPFLPNMNPPLEAYKAKSCAMARTSPRDCNAKYPIIFFGKDVQGHTDLIDEAFGYGISPMLNYKYPGYKPGWYRNLIAAGDVCGLTGGDTGNDCDEYPYRSTDQGGPQHFEEGRVLLRAVKSSENRSAGSMLFNRLIAPCKLQPSSIDYQHSGFVVVPTYSPVTIGRCADGTYHAGAG